MDHETGEARVKGLQKEFLSWVEDHYYLSALEPARFNKIRHRAFSSTFEAFRLGRVGLRSADSGIALWRKFFGWATVAGLPKDVELEVQAKCFTTSLEAFRVGAMVTGAEREHAI